MHYQIEDAYDFGIEPKSCSSLYRTTIIFFIIDELPTLSR